MTTLKGTGIKTQCVITLFFYLDKIGRAGPGYEVGLWIGELLQPSSIMLIAQ
jgi:hypothetical protein